MTWAICSHWSLKKREWANCTFFKLTKKRTKNVQTSDSLNYHEQPERIAYSHSFVMSHLSDSLMVALLTWGPERYAYSRSFVLIDLSKSLTVTQLIRAIWENERWTNEQIPNPALLLPNLETLSLLLPSLETMSHLLPNVETLSPFITNLERLSLLFPTLISPYWKLRRGIYCILYFSSLATRRGNSQPQILRVSQRSL